MSLEGIMLNEVDEERQILYVTRVILLCVYKWTENSGGSQRGREVEAGTMGGRASGVGQTDDRQTLRTPPGSTLQCAQSSDNTLHVKLTQRYKPVLPQFKTYSHSL